MATPTQNCIKFGLTIISLILAVGLALALCLPGSRSGLAELRSQVTYVPGSSRPDSAAGGLSSGSSAERQAGASVVTAADRTDRVALVEPSREYPATGGGGGYVTPLPSQSAIDAQVDAPRSAGAAAGDAPTASASFSSRRAGPPDPPPERRADASEAPGGAAAPALEPLLVDFVIARYDEDVNWLAALLPDLRLHGIEPQLFIYEKGPGPLFRIHGAKNIRLPNLGRESYAYLHHMATAEMHQRGGRRGGDVTVYLQADPHTFGLPMLTLLELLIYQAMKHGLSTNVRHSDEPFGLPSNWDASYKFSYPKGAVRLGTIDLKGEFKLGQWWDARIAPHFYNVTYPPPPQRVSFYQGACFAVHSALQLPASFVKADDTWREELGVSNAPEVGHFYERSWFFFFWIARSRLPPAGGLPWWRGDGLDPLTLESRRLMPDFKPPYAWDWDGCEANWDDVSRRGALKYSCVELQQETEDGLRWAWEPAPGAAQPPLPTRSPPPPAAVAADAAAAPPLAAPLAQAGASPPPETPPPAPKALPDNFTASKSAAEQSAAAAGPAPTVLSDPAAEQDTVSTEAPTERDFDAEVEYGDSWEQREMSRR